CSKIANFEFFCRGFMRKPFHCCFEEIANLNSLLGFGFQSYLFRNRTYSFLFGYNEEHEAKSKQPSWG
ncbi:hypothetical protein J1N35_007660, partial [Gossypium stocksii]